MLSQCNSARKRSHKMVVNWRPSTSHEEPSSASKLKYGSPDSQLARSAVRNKAASI